jgi:hypothetical protein
MEKITSLQAMSEHSLKAQEMAKIVGGDNPWENTVVVRPGGNNANGDVWYRASGDVDYDFIILPPEEIVVDP